MQATPPLPELHAALDLVAQACMRENLVEEADGLRHFLDLAGTAPRTAGLLQVWLCSQRGELKDALRACDALVQREPEDPELLTLLAVLRHACGDAGWRAVGDRLLDGGLLTPENRQLILRLRDGSAGPAAPAAEAPAVARDDYAVDTNYMRG